MWIFKIVIKTFESFLNFSCRTATGYYSVYEMYATATATARRSLPVALLRKTAQYLLLPSLKRIGHPFLLVVQVQQTASFIIWILTTTTTTTTTWSITTTISSRRRLHIIARCSIATTTATTTTMVTTTIKTIHPHTTRRRIVIANIYIYIYISTTFSLTKKQQLNQRKR